MCGLGLPWHDINTAGAGDRKARSYVLLFHFKKRIRANSFSYWAIYNLYLIVVHSLEPRLHPGSSELHNPI
jgi:hypothetical protein